MKQRKHRRKESQRIDSEFAEALYEGESASRSSERQAARKARQFCRQVQRALNIALEDRTAEELSGLFVDDVTPAPDCGRLMVHVFIPPGRSLVNALDALRRATPVLRSEVAMAITRKRAPELSFVPAITEGGNHE